MMDHQKWFLVPNLMAFKPVDVETFHAKPKCVYIYIYIFIYIYEYLSASVLIIHMTLQHNPLTVYTFYHYSPGYRSILF